MSQVYRSNETAEKIPEIDVTIRGGLGVLVHNPSEIDGLIGVCMDAGSIPGVYRALLRPSKNLEDVKSWSDIKELLLATDSESEVDSLMEDSLNGPMSLIPALYAAQKLWLAQREEAELLRLVLLLPKNDGTEDNIRVEAEKAAFVIRPGSLIGDLVSGTFRATTWVICFFARGGTSTSARRKGMVQRLRQAALRNGPQLRDIHSPAAPSDRPLVVLIHGLFATDVGTFGALQPLLEKHFEVVGFPHDTLTESIGANGLELARLLGRFDGDRIHLVAHSRGGLVARSAVTQLKKHSPHLNIRRCVTFGTPHLGAELAENPGGLILSVALLTAGNDGKSGVSILDILCCFSEKGNFPGVLDLRPASSNATWLAQLQAEEGLYPDAMADLFAVGGTKAPKSLVQRIAKDAMQRLIGDDPNDLVVRQDSSLPPLISVKSQRHAVTCDHFGYFGMDQESILKQAVDFLLRP